MMPVDGPLSLSSPWPDSSWGLRFGLWVQLWSCTLSIFVDGYATALLCVVVFADPHGGNSLVQSLVLGRVSFLSQPCSGTPPVA